MAEMSKRYLAEAAEMERYAQGRREQDLKDMLKRDPPLTEKEQSAVRFALQIIREYKLLLEKSKSG